MLLKGSQPCYEKPFLAYTIDSKRLGYAKYQLYFSADFYALLHPGLFLKLFLIFFNQIINKCSCSCAFSRFDRNPWLKGKIFDF